MGNTTLSLRCLLALGVSLAGCEVLSEVARELERRGSREGTEVDAGPRIERGATHARFGDRYVLHATPRRGLSVIDVSHADHPQLVGRFDAPADGLSLYRVGERVLLVTGRLPGYDGVREDVPYPPSAGGAVLNIDLSDPTQPQLSDRINLSDPRMHVLQRDGETANLFMLENAGGTPSQSLVTRFELRDGKLAEARRFQLQGLAKFMIARPPYLVVAVYAENGATRFTVFNVASGGFQVASRVVIPVNVDDPSHVAIDDRFLRVLYNARWMETAATVDTWDISMGTNSVRVSQCEQPESVLTENSPVPGFLDPPSLAVAATQGALPQLHRFVLDDDGGCATQPAFDDQLASWSLWKVSPDRMLGFGQTSSVPTRMVFSLYDTSALGVGEPLLARSEHPMDYGRAEGAIDLGASGGREGRLVAVGYRAYDYDTRSDGVGYQLLSLSDQTFTQRATIPLNHWAHGIFRIGRSTLATLTPTTLEVLDASDLDAVRKRGRVRLASNYTHLFPLGAYVARIRETDAFESATGERQAELQIIARDAAEENATPLASLLVPRDARWWRMGDMLVSLEDTGYDWNDPLPDFITTISVFDVSDPLRPRARGSLTTSEILPQDSFRLRELVPYLIGNALVFSSWPEDGWKVNARYDVVDLRDADRPRLRQPAFELPSEEDSPSGPAFVAGTTLFAKMSQRWGSIPDDGPPDYLYPIDFSDPLNPQVGARLPDPGPVLLATQTRFFVSGDPSEPEARLSSVSWSQGTTRVEATRTWPNAGIGSLQTDGAGHLVLLAGPAFGTYDPSDPKAGWVRLEIIDETTLETLGTTELDRSVTNLRVSDGRALVDGPNSVMLVDIREPSAPKVHAVYFKSERGVSLLAGDDLYVASDAGAFHFNAAVSNLVPAGR